MLYSWNSSFAQGVSNFKATRFASPAGGGQAAAGQTTNNGDSGLWAAASANYSEPGAPSLQDVSANATAGASGMGAPQSTAASAGRLLATLGTNIADQHVELDPFKIGSPI